MIALYIIGGILLFLILLLSIPVRVEIAFREEFLLNIRYLFLKFRLMPGEETEEKPEKEKKEKKKTEKEKKPGSGKEKLKGILQRHGFKGFLDSLFEAVGLALSAGKRILSHLKLKRFDLYLCLAGAQDAGEAAIRYGQISAGVYSACGVLFTLMPCRKKGVSVDLDYRGEENLVDFTGTLSIRPIIIVKEGVCLVVRELVILFRLLGPGKKRKERSVKMNPIKKGETQ